MKKESTRPASTRSSRSDRGRPAKVQAPSAKMEATAALTNEEKPTEELKEEAPRVTETEVKTGRVRRSPLRFALFLVAALLIVLVGASAVFSIGIYRLGWQGRLVDRIVTAIPFPIVLADHTIIRYNEYKDDVQTLNYYFDNNAQLDAQQQKPGADEITATVLNRLVYDSVVSELVKQHNVSITDAELEEQIAAIVDTSGSRENVSALLQSLYGWNEDQFKEKVLRPYVALQKLEKTLTENGTLNGDSEQRAKDVLAKVKEGSTPFEDLAKEYSEDTTASVGGDLGFFGKDEMDADFMTAVEALDVGQTTTELVKSQYGYHIIKLLEKVDDPDKGTQYHASHILIRAKTIDDFVNEQIARRTIRVLLRGFTWDAENHWIVPSSQAQG